MDPPFFYIPLDQMFRAVEHVCRADYSTKLMISWRRAEEHKLLRHFEPFQLRRTTFKLEYKNVKPGRWHNYVLYSNTWMPGVWFEREKNRR